MGHGLANREAFMLRLREKVALAGGAQEAHPFAVLFIDLNHFKHINDRWGHEYGDAALKSIGETLRSTVRSGDIAVRLGGDEFAVIAALDGHATGAFNLAAPQARVRVARLICPA